MLLTGLIIILLGLSSLYWFANREKQNLDPQQRGVVEGDFIQLSQGITHYQFSGPDDGRLVVLVHGGTIPMWTWDKQIIALNQAGYRTLIYDKYGRGFSDKPSVLYDQALYQNQLAELIEQLGIKQPFDLIGLSLGGGTVTNFSVQHPEKIDKLVLIAPVVNDYPVQALIKIPRVGEFMTRLFGIKLIVQRFGELFTGNPEAAKYQQLYEQQTCLQGFQHSLLSMLRNDAIGDYRPAYQQLGTQQRDILLVWGRSDLEITEPMINAVRTRIPRLQFEPVSNAGHGIVFQKPELINQLLLDFLSQPAH